MQVIVDASGQVKLEDLDDFRSFQVTLSNEISYKTLETVIDAVGRLDGESSAWIRETALRKLGRDDPVWQEKLTGMIGFAARRGWTDPATGDIRAHIVGSIRG
jgi:hypothetical protein